MPFRSRRSTILPRTPTRRPEAFRPEVTAITVRARNRLANFSASRRMEFGFFVLAAENWRRLFAARFQSHPKHAEAKAPSGSPIGPSVARAHSPRTADGRSVMRTDQTPSPLKNQDDVDPAESLRLILVAERRITAARRWRLWRASPVLPRTENASGSDFAPAPI